MSKTEGRREKEKATCGPQSLRAGSRTFVKGLGKLCTAHELACFSRMVDNEREMEKEWAVFYHCYSAAHVLMEVNAAIAHVVYGYDAQAGPLPRLLGQGFGRVTDVASLLRRGFRNDHEEAYRNVAISVNTSLVHASSEASPLTTFGRGYSVVPRSVLSARLRDTLRVCGVEEADVESVARELEAACGRVAPAHPATKMSGREGAREEWRREPGRILQIFIRRDKVDTLAYAAHPMGRVDATRMPLSRTLGSPTAPAGQARIVCMPEEFMDSDVVRVHSFAASERVHEARPSVVRELVDIVRRRVVPSEAARQYASATLCGRAMGRVKAPARQGEGDAAEVVRKEVRTDDTLLNDFVTEVERRGERTAREVNDRSWRGVAPGWRHGRDGFMGVWAPWRV